MVDITATARGVADSEAARAARPKVKFMSGDGSIAISIPRWVLIASALWFGLLETATQVPNVLLAIPNYRAALAEAEARPGIANANLEKARQEARAAAWQPALTAAQAFKAEVDATAGGMTLEAGSAGRLGLMFDIIDPDHPNLVSKGLIEPDISPLIPLITVKKK